MAEQTSVFQQKVDFPISFSVDNAVFVSSANALYAISKDEQALYCIDTATLQLKAEYGLRYTPQSICTDGKNIFVCFKDKPYIFKSDCSGAYNGEYYNCGRAYSTLGVYGDALYALTAAGDLYALSATALDSRANIVIKGQNVKCFDVEGDYIYANITASAFSFVYKISADDYKIAATVKINSECDKIYATKSTVIAGGTIISTEDFKHVHSFYEPICYADNGYILTESGLYSNGSFKRLGTHYHDTTVPIFDNGYSYYSFCGNSLIKIVGQGDSLTSLPTVDGIKHGETLEGPVVPIYEYGAGYVDNVQTESGEPIYNGGRHTFTICKAFGVSNVYTFYIEADISRIALSYSKSTICVNETASASVSAYPVVTVNVDTIYSVNNDCAIVSEDGTVMGVKPGECIITATTIDGLHSASCTVTVTESKIIFDSSYFREEDDGVVGNIAPGTSIEALFSAVELTHGTVVPTTKDGTEISVGIISTEMKILLHDVNGDVIDERSLSVFCDVDCDGYLTANDYFVLQSISRQPEGISNAVRHAADTDGNGKVDVFDLLTIQEQLLGQKRLEEAKAIPERAARAVPHLVMPKHVTPGTNMTVGITLTDAQNVSGVSGVITFDPTVYTVLSVNMSGEDDEGFYSVETDGIYFFTQCSMYSSEVLLTVNFEISELYTQSDNGFIACNALKVYDGSAAACPDISYTPEFSAETIPDLLIFNLPDFEFDFNTSYYALEFEDELYDIYVAAYPENYFVITGNTSLTDGTAVFSAVRSVGGEEAKYNFVCTANGITAPPTSNNQSASDNNSALLSVEVLNGTLTPVFDKRTLQYFVICDDFNSVVFNATAEAPNAQTEVSELDRSTNSVTIRCTAENGEYTQYVFTLSKGSPATLEPPQDEPSRKWLWILIGGFVFIALIALVGYQTKLIIKNKNE